jgi:hypothetical protein
MALKYFGSNERSASRFPITSNSRDCCTGSNPTLTHAPCRQNCAAIALGGQPVQSRDNVSCNSRLFLPSYPLNHRPQMTPPFRQQCLHDYGGKGLLDESFLFVCGGDENVLHRKKGTENVQRSTPNIQRSTKKEELTIRGSPQRIGPLADQIVEEPRRRESFEWRIETAPDRFAQRFRP